ncbi:MAG: GNAT family N-acetyltransferase [Clostridia bacterium]|nr:GNAT family N-acetyltransferase [Clostridia bacterium]
MVKNDALGRIRLRRAALNDAEALHGMQVAAFAPLLAKYRDTAISPAAETLDRVREKLCRPETRFYFIMDGRLAVGAVRAVIPADPSRRKVISPLFVMAPYRGRDFAQQAVHALEALYGPAHWALDTILEEPGNCHLYEKLGYRRVGASRVNPRMTIVDYEKD